MTDNNDTTPSDSANDSSSSPENYHSQNPKSRPGRMDERSDGECTDAKNESFSRADWETVSSDPDLQADLGYAVTAWETIETATDSDQIIYMPQDEELLKDDTFIVANEDVLCDLGKKY